MGVCPAVILDWTIGCFVALRVPVAGTVWLVVCGCILDACALPVCPVDD